ncbi:MAG: DUF5011 domain-containing protein [Lachnospiraceae bacterium]|nr:DUF5011 domain-containing protein [Lachnospiraceae bacterium]
MIYENSEFQNEVDGVIGTWYQDVSLSAADIVRAQGGQLQVYASANIWGAAAGWHYGAVTLLFYNSAGQVYNGDSKAWGSAPSLSDHNTMYGASGATKYSVTIGGTKGKYESFTAWYSMYLGASGNLSGYSYTEDKTEHAYTNGITVPAGTVKIRYCLSHHCSILWSAAKLFCLKLKDAVAPSITAYQAVTSDGKNIEAPHAAGTVITYTIRFSEKVTVNSGGTLETSLGTAVYTGNTTANELTSVTYTYTIPESGTISDDAVVGLTSLTGLKVTDDAGNVSNISLSESNFNQNTNFGTSGVIRMDNRPPELVSFTSEGVSSGTFLKAGDVLEINANFHENVTISGAPTITLSNGTTMSGTQESSTDSSMVTFRYTVEDGADVNHLTIQSCDLSGIIDKVGKASTESLRYEQFCEDNRAYLDPYQISVDTTSPGITFEQVEIGYLNRDSQVTVRLNDHTVEGVTGSGVSEVWSVWTQDSGSSQPGFSAVPNVQNSETGIYTISKPETEGTWYLWVKAEDAVGNIGIAKSEGTYVFDLSVPNITITNECYENTGVTQSVSVTCRDSLSGFQTGTYTWKDADGLVVGSGTLSEESTIIPLPEEHGIHTLTVTAEDHSGNVGEKQSENILIDRTAPEIFISGENSEYMQSNTLTVSTVDADTGIAWNSYGWSTSPILKEEDMDWTALEADTVSSPEDVDGTWYLHVKSEDLAGNIAYAVSEGCCIDQIAPVIQIEPNGNAGSEGYTEYAVLVTVSDRISLEEDIHAEYALSEGTDTENLEYQSFTESCELSVILDQKDMYIHVRAVDQVGNAAVFCSDVFAADVCAPTGSVKVVSDLFTNQNTAVLELTGADNDVESDELMMKLYVDGTEADWTDFSVQQTVEFEKTEGNHRFAVQFQDPSGNVSELFAAGEEVVYDVTKPEITVTYSTEAPTNQDVTVSASINEEGSTFQGEASHVFTDNGTFTFTAVDRAGNVSGKQAEVTWIDKTGPDIVLLCEEADQRPHQTAMVHISAADASNGVEKVYYRYSLQGEAAPEWQTYTDDGVILEGLDGSYLFEAYGVDTLGNESEITGITIWMDNTVPTASISYSPDKRTAQNVTASITFDEENVTVSNTEGQTNAYVFTENGTFQFAYQDAAGNQGTAEAEVTWIDRSLPSGDVMVKDLEGNELDREQWTSQDWKVTILPQQNSYVKSVIFNGEEIEEEELFDTYIIQEYGILQYVLRDSETEVESMNSVEIRIDKEAPVCGDDHIRYSETGWTNQNVTAFAEPQDLLSGITCYVRYVDADGNEVEEETGRENAYVFTENGSCTFIFEDEAGNRSEKTVTVANIDRDIPIAHISCRTADGNAYDPNNWTNQDVTAEISFEDVSTVRVTSNQGEAVYTFGANGSMTFVYKDEAGNEGQTEVRLEKIDKTPPSGYVTMDRYTWTNQDITATLHAVDEDSGAEDMTYTFTENGTYTFVLKDHAGNQAEISCIQDRIDKTPPELDIYYSITEKTPFAVYAKVSADESVQWKSNVSCRFDANGSYTFTAVDRAGNQASKEAIVNWINRAIPEVELVYSTTELTNQDVIVELKAKNEGELISVLNNDRKSFHRFEENGEFTFEYANASHTEKATVTAQVDWIDKKAPQLTITYSTQELTNTDVTVTVCADKEVRWPNGLIRNEDGSASCTFHENQKVLFTVSDLLGNKGTVLIDISNIDRQAPKIQMEELCMSVPLGQRFDALDGVTVLEEHPVNDMLVIENPVDTERPGLYTVRYTAADVIGNQSEQTRTVIVYDPDEFQVIVNDQLAAGQEIILEEPVMDLQTIHQEGNAVLQMLPGKAKIGEFKMEGAEISESHVFEDRGYYTLLVRDGERNTKLITIYVMK